MILQDRNDVLATVYELPSAGEIDRAFIIGTYSISNPRAQECLIEPYRVLAECRSPLYVECEPCFGASGHEVCWPEGDVLLSVMGTLIPASR